MTFHIPALLLVSALIIFSSQTVEAVTYESIHQIPCPTGWNHDTTDDTCNAVWPRVNHNNSVGVKVSFDEAAEFCALHGAELPLVYNLSYKLEYYNDLAGRTSGRKWWVGVRADKRLKTPVTYITRQQRTSGFHFDWDTRMHQPGAQHCVVQYMRGDGKKIHGGRAKMQTVDCWERHSVICTKPRVPPHFSAINGNPPGRVEANWGYENKYTFWGMNLPYGTQVTMQTTTEGEFTTGPNQPTHCKHVGIVTGASQPLTLNISANRFYHKLCNGTCQTASITFPADWPFVRGAKYSFCFFIPRPWKTPEVPTEYDYELLGPETYLEVVQKHEDYLRDVCLRRAHNLDMFYGNGWVDTNRDPAEPFYFNSAVEGGRT